MLVGHPLHCEGITALEEDFVAAVSELVRLWVAV